MISTAKPVTKYLSNKYSTQKSESDAVDEDIKLTAQEKPDSINVSVSDLVTVSEFTAPAQKTPPLTTISYKKPKSLVEKLKKYTKLSSNKEVGIETFDYYVELEGIE